MKEALTVGIKKEACVLQSVVHPSVGKSKAVDDVLYQGKSGIRADGVENTSCSYPGL